MKEELSQLEKGIEVLERLLSKERSQGNYKEALDRAVRIVELSEKLYKLDPSQANKHKLQISRNQLTELENVYKQLKESAQTEKISDETIKQVKELLEGAQSFSRSGDIALVTGDHEEALFFYENALEFNYLAVKLWENYETLRELEGLHTKIAYIYELSEEYNKAKKLYEANRDIDQKILDNYKSQENFDKTIYTIRHLADILLNEDIDQALKLYKKNIKIREEAVKTLQTSESYHDLQNEIIKAARTAQKQGREHEALHLYEEVLPVIEMIQEKGFADTRTPLLREVVIEQIKKLSLE